MLSVLNEVQHEHFYEGLGVPAAKAYTRCYDAIVSESRKVYPALEFVGPELGPIKWDKEHTTDFLGYFLDPHNHADGKAPNQISFHCKIDADAFIDLIGRACRLANLKSLPLQTPTPLCAGSGRRPKIPARISSTWTAGCKTKLRRWRRSGSESRRRLACKSAHSPASQTPAFDHLQSLTKCLAAS